MNELKPYIGILYLRHLGTKKVQVLVAAYSKTEASRILEVSLDVFNKRFKETSNLKHIEIALSKPQKPLYSLKNEDFWQEYNFYVIKPTCCSQCVNGKEFKFIKITEGIYENKNYKVASWECLNCGQLILKNID